MMPETAITETADTPAPGTPGIYGSVACDQMLAEIKSPTGIRGTRAALKTGRAVLARKAYAVAKVNPGALADDDDRARYGADLVMLRRMCQMQYVLRRRELKLTGRDLTAWATPPDTPREPGSVSDVIAHANAVAAARGNSELMAQRLGELLIAARAGLAGLAAEKKQKNRKRRLKLAAANRGK